MPRRMKDAGVAYRAVITYQYDGREPWVEYQGPYATVGNAKSRATWAKRRERPGFTVITQVERASTNWERVE